MRVALCINKHRQQETSYLWKFFKRLGRELTSRGVKVVFHGREKATIKSCPVHVRNHSCRSDRNNWNVKEGYIAPYAYFDRCGYAGWSEFCSNEDMQREMGELDAEESLLFFDKFSDNYRRAKDSKYKQVEKGFKLHTPYVFVACQLPHDTVMKHAYIRTFEMAKMVAEAYRDTEVTVVVKPHPMAKSANMVGFVPLRSMPNVLVTSASIHEIIPGSTCVYTVNSGVGLEALLYEKPVFVTGRSEYQLGCQVLQTRADIITSVTNAKVFDKAKVSRLIHYLFTRHFVDVMDPAAIAGCADRLFEEAGWSEGGK